MGTDNPWSGYYQYHVYNYFQDSWAICKLISSYVRLIIIYNTAMQHRLMKHMRNQWMQSHIQ